jgi:hypothetical protein
MVKTVEFRLTESQLHAFADAIETAKAEIEESRKSEKTRILFSKKLGRVIQSSLEIPRVLQRLWDSTLDLIAARLLEDYQETGQQLRASFVKALQVLKEVESLVHAFHQAGGSVKEEDALQGAIKDIRLLESSIFSHWPHFSEQDVADARVEDQQGQCWDPDEAFARIAGVDEETWIQRVQEHKHAHPS